MKHILQVLKFEYLTCVKSKSFIFTTLLFIAMILLMSFLPGIILSMNEEDAEPPVDSEGQPVLPVIAVSNDAYEDSTSLTAYLKLYFQNYEIKLTEESHEDIMEHVDSEDYTFAIELKAPLSFTYITKSNGLYSTYGETAREALLQYYKANLLSEIGVTEEQAQQILYSAVEYDTVTTGTDMTQNYWSSYILFMIIYIAIIMYGQMVSQSVVSEKNTRAMEMLITCAKPSHLMFGKVLGSGLAGLTQLVLITVTALGSINTISAKSIPEEILQFINFTPEAIAYALLFFVLAYFVYAFLLASFSSLASRSEDLNTLTAPVMMLFVAASMVVLMSMGSGSVDGIMMKVCSYVPLAAPLAMFARITLSDVAWYEIVISVVTQLITIYLLGMLAAAIYRIGVLMYGNPPKPAEVIKSLFAQRRELRAAASKNKAE